MQAVQITDKIYWVGAIDWDLRNFHGYATSRGSTYNAYLILDDKVTLIDTVKAPFKDEMMSRIASVIDPKEITYIVSNHSEMDHSGSLPQIIKEVSPDKVFASTNGVKTLQDHFHLDYDITSVKDGEDLNIGSITLSFFETRMIHWPDSMFTFAEGEGVLFSQDGFGMHLASSERFDDELDFALLEYEATKYYANILTPFSQFIAKLLDKMEKLSLPIKLIAPDHGPIWRKDIKKIVSLYSKWAEQKPTKKAVICFDTMWQSTELMAKNIEDGLASKGVDVKLMNLSHSHRSDVATELLNAGALLIGSPTINNQIFPTVADVISYIKGLKFKNLIGAAFGSYGWSGESVKLIKEHLKEMKVQLIEDEINIKYVPTEEDLVRCQEFGKMIGDKLNKMEI
jgi:flavorubredoxin